jgi:hypothetical protein
LRPEYYWSADETEWATDLMFRSPAALDAIYPSLLYHAMRISDSPSVMRYFGRGQISQSGQIKGRAPQEVMTECRKFYEGFRVKHWLNRNSIKVYNKDGSILRIETTINHTRDFKVFRSPADDARRPPSWQQRRKGVSDLHRRCEISDQCNERYAEALASAQVQEKLQEIVAPACNRIRTDGQSYRGLNPWQEQDYQLLRFLAQGQQALNGFQPSPHRSFDGLIDELAAGEGPLVWIVSFRTAVWCTKSSECKPSDLNELPSRRLAKTAR